MSAIKTILYLVVILPLVAAIAVICGLLLGMAIYVGVVLTIISETYRILNTYVRHILGTHPIDVRITQEDVDAGA